MKAVNMEQVLANMKLNAANANKKQQAYFPTSVKTLNSGPFLGVSIVTSAVRCNLYCVALGICRFAKSESMV